MIQCKFIVKCSLCTALLSKKSESSISGRLYTGYKVAKCNKFKFAFVRSRLQDLAKPALWTGGPEREGEKRGGGVQIPFPGPVFLNPISQPIFPQILVSFQFCACDPWSQWPKSYFPTENEQIPGTTCILPLHTHSRFYVNSLYCSIITVASRRLVKTYSIATNNENSPRLSRLCIRKQYVFINLLYRINAAKLTFLLSFFYRGRF